MDLPPLGKPLHITHRPSNQSKDMLNVQLRYDFRK
jgi:hypothetical protein